MKSNIKERLHRRIIKEFMDILILSELARVPMSGYDIIKFIRRRFGILVSSGTVYSILYSMEREGMIAGIASDRKRIYRITENGEQSIRSIRRLNGETINLVKNILLPHVSS